MKEPHVVDGSPFPRAQRPLPTRQVHLDFHTSEHIPGIGAEFSKAQWQAALKEGHLNAINIFAKGHHGWSYYPTEVGSMHPHLDFDLLGAQIEGCHEIGVECPSTIRWGGRSTTPRRIPSGARAAKTATSFGRAIRRRHPTTPIRRVTGSCSARAASTTST